MSDFGDWAQHIHNTYNMIIYIRAPTYRNNLLGILTITRRVNAMNWLRKDDKANHYRTKTCSIRPLEEISPKTNFVWIKLGIIYINQYSSQWLILSGSIQRLCQITFKIYLVFRQICLNCLKNRYRGLIVWKIFWINVEKELRSIINLR